LQGELKQKNDKIEGFDKVKANLERTVQELKEALQKSKDE